MQNGVRDYEKFNSQLDSLARWISEPEEVLRAQDPNGSSDLSLIQDRMEQLKVPTSAPLPVCPSVCVWSVCLSCQPVPPVSLPLCLSVHLHICLSCLSASVSLL